MAERGRNYVWYGAEYRRRMVRHMAKNMDAAATYLVDKIQDSFGESGVRGERSGATRAQRAANRSQAWGPPNVDSGHLKRNIGYDRPGGRPLVRRVGTGIGNKRSVGYAQWLEFGTRSMLPRPFLRPAAYYHRLPLRRIMSRPMR